MLVAPQQRERAQQHQRERQAVRVGRLVCEVPEPSAEHELERLIGVLRRHCADVGRDPAEVAVTVLDVPLIGADADDVAARVERHRGRTPAAAYAARSYAGTAADQVQRYRRLADLGVDTVFLALPDLRDADDLARCAPLLAALA